MAAQKLYAQSPLTTGMSGTSAYIGIEPSARYNETVLFENQSAATAAMELSAPVTSFEYLKFIGFWNYNGQFNSMAYIEVPTNFTEFSMHTFAPINGDASTNSFYQCSTMYQVSGNNKIVVRKCLRRRDDGTMVSNDDGIKVARIIGINRKENA